MPESTPPPASGKYWQPSEAGPEKPSPNGSGQQNGNLSADSLADLVRAYLDGSEDIRNALMGLALSKGQRNEFAELIRAEKAARKKGETPAPKAKVIPPGPPSHLDELHAALNAYIYVADFVPYDVTLACAVGYEETDSDPFWVMIVGPASGGKTEAINLCDSFADERKDELTSQAALLGWLPPKGKVPGKKTGLLTRIPSPAFVTIKDFAPLLDASNKGTRDQLYSAIRGMYDGRYDREIGGVEKAITWEGRVTLLAACTNAIDHYASHNDALGPRWVYCRLQDSDHGKAMMLRRNGGTAEHRKAAQGIAAALVRDGRARLAGVVLSDKAHEQIEEAAELCAMARGSVPRVSYGKREIDGMPDVEAPYRLCGQLRLLTRSLMALGMTEAEAVAIARRCAMDTTSRPRLAVLKALAASPEFDQTCGAVSRATGGSLSAPTALRHLEDLECIGLVEATDRPDPDSVLFAQPSGGKQTWSRAGIHWRLAPGQKKLILGGLQTNSAHPSPNPPIDKEDDHE
ncbi:hypothetical protein [Streptomyces sp. 4N124]|uniref:hypothetical protein n=1 Tax=Streptomyces sp. 4N124 TaxID=3457420 RepID=UPI003FD68074